MQLGQHQGAEEGGHHGGDVGAAGFQGGTAHDQRGDKVEAGAPDGEQSEPTGPQALI